ncbi:putative diguanylate cyclase/phosphodiesterase [Actinoplanes missouriensis 431]|uniref:Putative diguanylate cyclase/phosphodiesterase n=1 Tax=Actinoplanes missouriensis (strain ATCC 14538 / DSM 43046 / CBS 188.64 / JCM 3121 / NBRC 102363 / NCIMB 12654 / NRRL B-3342 / UNCC 431) TaxID=512565 RepID=I0GZE4_ACTM4|nr:bifunctional diguanylate cyclase/phosphodiesterase [Actinoplanes missouriensis]BAL86131.1 putative diguanylate cyclase/phosphodiesterase [Actinoplanes missouriensis 431]
MGRHAFLDRVRVGVDDTVVIASLVLLAWPAEGGPYPGAHPGGHVVPLLAALCLGLAVLLLDGGRPALRTAVTAAALVTAGFRQLHGELTPTAVGLVLLVAIAVLAREYLGRRVSADLSRQQSLLAQHAFRDSLTGLGNRRMFLEYADGVLHEPSRAQTAVVIVDLDGFKALNEFHGHEIGDNLLRAAADRLSTNVRAGDTVARLDGDEFAVLLPGVEDEQAAIAVAERVLTELHRPLTVAGIPMSVRVSAGVAVAGRNERLDSVLRRADQALFRAKQEGGGVARRFDPVRFAAAEARRRAEADLLRGLDAGEFEVYYQPIVDLAGDDRTVGVEALIRWRHPEYGLIPPADFLDLAESLGLLPRIGGWVLEESCRQAIAWQRQFPGFELNVNLSASQLGNPRLIDEVREILDRTGLPPNDLVLELTESVALTDLDESARVLGGLKSLGVRLALDDFGTGFSSLSHLSTLPVDVVKIDRSFVQGMPSSGGASVAEAVLHIARTFDLAPVAEGVEDAAQADWLRGLGAGRAQGYHFARPMPADEVTSRLDQEALVSERAA